MLQFEPKLDKYVSDAKRLRNLAIDKETEKKSLITKAQEEFSKKKDKIIEELKKTFGQGMQGVQDYKGKMDAGFALDKARQELANVPLKIDDTITKIKDSFDLLLGKALGMYPDSPTFDLQQTVKLLEAQINPVLAATNPLAAITGPIPLLGDVIKLISTVTASSDSQVPLSKDEIKKIVGDVPPPMPDGLGNKTMGIVSDIRDMIPVFPMMMINLTFAMLNVIYSKLQVISSVVPLGSLFPLNLIPAAITAIPLMIKMMYTLPGYAESMVEGMVRQKIAEAMAMKMPQTEFDPATIKSLVGETWSNEQTTRASTEKNLTYDTVIDQFFQDKARDMGYTKMQLKEILKNYLKINDGSKIPLTKYIDDGEQKLEKLSFLTQLGGSSAMAQDFKTKLNERIQSSQYQMPDPSAMGSDFSSKLNEKISSSPYQMPTDAASLAQDFINKATEKLGYEEKQGNKGVPRLDPSPEDFQTYLEKCIAPIPGADPSGGIANSMMLKYNKCYDLKDLMGGYYDSLNKLVTLKIGDPVVLVENLPKSPIRAGSLLPSSQSSLSSAAGGNAAAEIANRINATVSTGGVST